MMSAQTTAVPTDGIAHEGSCARDLSALRIALVSGNYNCLRDGANRAQNMLVRYLLDHGARVRVFSPTCPEPAFDPAGELVSIPSAPLPFGRREYRIAWRLPRATREAIADFAPNLFHVSLPLFHGRSAGRLARRMGVPVVGAMHTRFETYPRYYGLSFLERPVLSLLRGFYRACDRVVVPSASIAVSMRELGMGERFGLWTRGVDTALFSPARRDGSWRLAHGFDEDMPVIAFFGRLVLEKGLVQFARTVRRLRDEGREFRVLVIGDGPAGRQFEDMLGEAMFVGFLHGEALSRALACADVLFNPSLTEGFSNVSLEAMACGLPVVAADATGNRDVVVDGSTGVLVAPVDEAGYARALRRYLVEPCVRRRHGVNARTHSETFSWEQAHEGIVDTYLEVLEERSRRRRLPKTST